MTYMNLSYSWRIARSLVIAGFLLMSGCAVGPNFKKPAAPDVSGYTVYAAFDYEQHRQRRRR